MIRFLAQGLCSFFLLMLTGCVGGLKTPKLVLRPHQVQVKEGESIYALAARHKTTPRQIMQANYLKSTALTPGEILIIPPQAPSKPPRAPIAYKPLEPVDVQAEISSEISSAPLLKTPPSSDIPRPVLEKQTSDFVWPLDGTVLESFGRGVGARALGITIGAPLGTNIKAARDGTVIYTGDALKEYGLLILVRHTDGAVTVYGNLAKILVEKDAEIKQGQIIAQVGKSGFQNLSPRLYFELRRLQSEEDTKPRAVNPLPYLSHGTH